MAEYYTYHAVYIGAGLGGVLPEVGDVYGRPTPIAWGARFTITAVYDLPQEGFEGQCLFEATLTGSVSPNVEYYLSDGSKRIRTGFYESGFNVGVFGRCLDSGGNPLPLTDVATTGFDGVGGEATVDDGGYYWDGHTQAAALTGTVTPSLDSYTFEPASLAIVAESRHVVCDFVGTSLLPGKPTNPDPPNAATSVRLGLALLSWEAGT